VSAALLAEVAASFSDRSEGRSSSKRPSQKSQTNPKSIPLVIRGDLTLHEKFCDLESNFLPKTIDSEEFAPLGTDTGKKFFRIRH